MNTRSKSDKNTVDEIYRAALEAKRNTQLSKLPIPHTSTPTEPSASKPKQLRFPLDDTVTDTYQTINSIVPSDLDSYVSGATLKLENSPSVTTPLKPTNEFLNFHTMAFNIVQYAIEAVPFFDGYNIPLGYFIEGCEEAKSMLPAETESQFTKILRSRITGEARRTIQGQNFDTIEELIKYLKKIFGFTKNASQLQGELGHAYQRDKEDVVTFANRIKLLGKQILEAHRNSRNMSAGQKDSVEQDMRRCFIRGLKPEIEQRVSRDLSIEETVADALQVERELREITELRQGPSRYAGQNPQTNRNRWRDTCQLCFQEGHTASNCDNLPQSS